MAPESLIVKSGNPIASRSYSGPSLEVEDIRFKYNSKIGHIPDVRAAGAPIRMSVD